MRMCRRLGTAGKRYTLYDYIEYYSTNNWASNQGRIITPVTETDVLIQTTYMPLYDEDISASIFSKSGGDRHAYGAGIYPWPPKAVLKLNISDDSDPETGEIAWIENYTTWYTLEIRMSLNKVSAAPSNYIKLGTHTLSLTPGGGNSDTADEPWCIFGCTDSVYTNGRSSLGEGPGAGKLQRTKFYNYSGGTLIADLYPCARSDGAKGMYDMLTKKFYPAYEGSAISTSSVFRVGNL